MAKRTSARHRVPGNPLAGVLRQSARQSRSTSRRAVSVPGPPGVPGEPGPEGATGVAGPPGGSATAVAVLTADATGTLTWFFPAPLQRPPVVTATPVASDQPVLATAVAVTATAATLRLWRPGAGGGAWTTAPGTVVQLAAFPAPAAPTGPAPAAP